MVNSGSVGLGPWRAADLQGTVGVYSGDGSDDDIDTVQRFGRSVCRLALRRLRQHLDDMRRDAIAIFLFQSTPPAGSTTIREPLLGDGGVEVCGKIWFVNVTAQSGRALAVDSEQDSNMFEEVERLKLGHLPAVVFNPKVAVPTVRIYGKGLSDESDIKSINIVDHEVTLVEIKRIVDLLHETQLITPDAQGDGLSMWVDPLKYWAASNAESIAQLQVKTALSVRLFNCDIRREQTMRAGRTDLEVVQHLTDGTTITPAEVEIKVLRERNKSGRKWSDVRIEKWVRRGVRQAAAYRDDRNAQSGMLCCFDMRERDRGDSGVFARVKLYADELDVTLHRNFLFNSAEAWRIAKYGS